jgi:4-carboxymuconolactone decarboxylase
MPTPKNAHTPGFKAGLAMRKKVLGADYVERAIANADDLGMPFQEIATEMAWGKVWTRPGLDLPTRSLVTLAMCIALNRPNEIKIHLRGAVRNGVTRVQIRELLLHSFMYCGGPAALDACAVVRTALPEIEAVEKAAKKAAKKPAAKKVRAPSKKRATKAA